MTEASSAPGGAPVPILRVTATVVRGYIAFIRNFARWAPSLIVVGGIAAVVAWGARVAETSWPAVDGYAGAVQITILYVLYNAVMTVYGGSLHRDRHEPDRGPSGPGILDIVPRLAKATRELMPRIGILAALLLLVGLTMRVTHNIEAGASVTVGMILMHSVLWVFAPIIAGSGEASGNAAFERSGTAIRWSSIGIFPTVLMLHVLTVWGIIVLVMMLTPDYDLEIQRAMWAFGTYAIGVPLTASVVEGAWATMEVGMPAPSPDEDRPMVFGDPGPLP